MRAVATCLLLAGLVVNGLANRLPLNGRTTGELSAQYPNLFVPAGVTFSIWGIIYLALLVWAGTQFLPRFREMGRRVAPAFGLACLLNAGWLFAWHYEQLHLSVAIMVALLATLVHLNRSFIEGGPLPARIAFGVYLGWICVATIANVTALLVGMGWDGAGLSDALWAGIMVGVGGGVGAATTHRLRNPYVGWAVVWALAGIVLNRWDDVAGIAAVAGGMMLMVGWVAARTPAVLEGR